MASVTTPYLTAKIITQRVNPVLSTLDYIAQFSTDLAGVGIAKERQIRILTSYKNSLKSFITDAVIRGTKEAVFYALSGAGESDNKNALLTPIIAGTPVNPGSVDNNLELIAILADGVQAAEDLQTIINNVDQILS